MSAPGSPTLVVRDAESAGRRVDVVIDGDRVAAVVPAGTVDQHSLGAAATIDARGGAVIPALHDHHLHLAAAAAALGSVDVGPPDVADAAAANRARAAASGGAGWIRAVNYHESVGPLDRGVLDRAAGGRPVRVQHRSGAAWVLNSAALGAVGVGEAPAGTDPPGVERASNGRPTGWLFRLDDWLREQVDGQIPDLAPVVDALVRAGVASVTDATPIASIDDLRRLDEAVRCTAFAGRATYMVGPGVAAPADGSVGWTKVVLGDHELPGCDDVAAWFGSSHEAGRPIAVHVVTAEALALAVAAWSTVGVFRGDRVEHAAVIPDGALGVIAQLGVTVVTQPGFVAARGDTYRDAFAAAERHELWRCGTLLDAGIPVAGGSDAPYGPLDPWLSVAAAVTRTTASGAVLGPGERIDARRALALYLRPAGAPGGPPRRVAPGVAADLCVLDRPLVAALAEPNGERVRATISRGTVRYSSGD